MPHRQRRAAFTALGRSYPSRHVEIALATDNLYHYEARTGLCYRSIRTRMMTARSINHRWLSSKLSLLLSCLGLVAALPCEAQNLVPNPSFEEYDTCRVVNDVYYPETGPLGWFSAAGTPDHFLSCLPYGSFNSAPNNFLAFQYPHDGECYAGVVTYRAIPTNIREYFMAQLAEPLVIGQQYYASCYAAVGWGGYPMNPPAWLYTSGFGMLFTMQQRQWVLNDPYPVPLNYAHVYSPAMITDTVGWTLLSGSFVADSAYQYVMMGNHFDDSNMDTMHIALQQFVSIGYILFDNLCVSADPKGCPVAVGMEEYDSNGPWLFPNPAQDRIAMDGIAIGTAITIHDAMGKSLWQGASSGDHFQLEVGHWARGAYILHAEYSGKRRSFKFVLVE